MKEKRTSFMGQPFLESRVLMALPHPVGLGLILPIHILIAVSPLGDLSFRKKDMLRLRDDNNGKSCYSTPISAS